MSYWNQIKQYLTKNPRKVAIGLFVLICHLIFLGTFFSSTPPTSLPVASEKMPLQVVTMTKPKAASPPKQVVVAKKARKPIPQKKPIPKIDRTEISVPKKVQIGTLPKQTEETTNPDYKQILLEYFQNVLTLPEHGEVELKVSLCASGEVKDIKILRSTSYKNECYLSHQLPKLRLPSFEKDHSKKNEETYIVVFRSK